MPFAEWFCPVGNALALLVGLTFLSFSSFLNKSFLLSPKAQELQKWIVSAYARKCSNEGQRADGCTVADRTRAFRQRFKLDVQLAIAAGLGAMLLTAGQPFENASF